MGRQPGSGGRDRRDAGGRLGHHLDRVYDQVIAFLAHLSRIANAKDDMERDMIDPVEKPDILDLYEAMNYPTHYPWSGGYMAQPYILMQELRTTELAIEQHVYQQEQNALAALQHQAEKAAQGEGISHVGVDDTGPKVITGAATNFFPPPPAGGD